MTENLAELRREILELRLKLDQLAHRVDSCSSNIAETPGAASPQCGTYSMQAPDGSKPVQICADNDRAGLYFYDKQNFCRGLIEITEKGVRFCLLNPEGKPIVSIKGIDGHGHICVAAPDGVSRAAIRSTKKGGVVKVLNAQGRPLGFLFGAETGGVLELNNQSYCTGVSLFAEDDGGMLRVHQASGEVMASISAHDDSGILTVFGSYGEQAVTLCGSEHGGHVFICDVDGSVRTELT